MKIALLLVSCFWLTCGAITKLHRIVEHVNSANVPWQAGINSFHTNDYKKLVGSFHYPDGAGEILDQYDRDVFGDNVGGNDCDTNNDDDDDFNGIAESFDARYHWFECPSISHIWNQGNCAADWAIAVTSTMNDRICIASEGNITALYSPQKLVSCCTNCGNGCNGGYTAAAWEYVQKRGIVTGGEYGSNEGCQPWLIPPCNISTAYNSETILGPHTMCAADHHSPTTPKCDLSCYNEKHETAFLDDIIKAKKVYKFDGCTARKILRKHGPYVATMRVYEDFLTYKSGVYQHVTGDYLGLLSVRMIGWGLERGQAYWLLANSWGTSWGIDGFFKIRRFVNECWIENFRYAGIPKL
ncbi:Peptidase C1A, papain C-terminal,Cysteine peptidase, asparagine active site [Cinara cedri]|uniref:Peptidase C1A, papain C-terminal,Cysteine peptidase, asparagine active site n=1 Tax=Cinara cedri TaxID=506608 RepID=A0A5E4MI69_9HEMI|nr:Peptidase C1A, papain C-terminal,Cysteine peptidase, asparagine active site [Cinara cedri]